MITSYEIMNSLEFIVLFLQLINNTLSRKNYAELVAPCLPAL